MNIKDILAPWTAERMSAAQREGWDLFTTSDDDGAEIVQVQRIDDPEELPPDAPHLTDDAAAHLIVRTGTGAHHSVARKIIFDHFPAEWAMLEAAAAGVWP